MLEHKGIEHRVVHLQPGLHVIQLRGHGFRGATVPGLNLDGRRVQTTTAISRFLDEHQREPRLLPTPEVVEAERWGERVLQPLPRRAFRWAVRRDMELRVRVMRRAGLPAPALMARVNAPLVHALAHASRSTDENVRRDLAALPGLLDKVDALIADGVIGGDEPNAADFQIGTTVRVLLNLEDLRPYVEGRPCEQLALRLMPEYLSAAPSFLPRDWLPQRANA